MNNIVRNENDPTVDGIDVAPTAPHFLSFLSKPQRANINSLPHQSLYYSYNMIYKPFSISLFTV
jgi:hypothetical protein